GQLSRDRISPGALKVVNRLTEHGYQAYLVGGCVRDALLGKLPKDFDVSTDAHPEEVRELFRNSRVIGRRFRIVHVGFGPEIVEVATFRAPHSEAQTEVNFSDGGMILSDNIYGTFHEDVLRRDFTMNALYYQPETDELLDEVGGLDDIKHQRIRLIGDPDNRFREDPVRMLRAIRFKAKLGFDIDPTVEGAMRRLGYLLQDIPPARLFEEVLKLFMNGHGEASFNELVEYDLLGWLFPDTRRLLHGTRVSELIGLALRSTDERVAQDKPVTPAFVYAALLWSPFIEAYEAMLSDGMSNISAVHEAASSIIGKQQLFTSIPRRFSGPMRDIWSLQFRLPARYGKKPEAMLRHKRFRAAYDFVILREQSGEDLEGLGQWWTEYQDQYQEGRAQMTRAMAAPRGRRRRRRKPGN
ncbi:MAG: polynucleotide adenylyltransferase PcnB, partial [Pseudomonadales bacterium]